MSYEEQGQSRREADEHTPVAPGAVDQRERDAGGLRPAWRRPVITRIGFERTLGGPGSAADGLAGGHM